MTRIIKTVAVLLLLTTGPILFGQTTNEEKAYAKGMEAIKLMDNGEFDKSLILLEEAKKLDPKTIDYPYEIAYLQYLKKDFKNSIKTLESLTKHSDVNDKVYQLLGNSYSMNEQREKAIETYEKGLKKFPSSGNLYLERGNMEMFIKEYGKALGFYEKGIELDPKFPSNYYWAAKIYCSSTEEVWGLIYGEIFMNLERNSKRTAEISKLLFDTYKSEITITGESAKIDFCNVVMNVDDIVGKDKIKFPFCMVFGQVFIMSIIGIETININSLDEIRTSFVENYFLMGHNKTHPNILINYQDQILKLGHSEAYNHWILMNGDEVGFDKWQSANKVKWDNFVKWFNDNGLKVNDTNKFYSGQY